MKEGKQKKYRLRRTLCGAFAGVSALTGAGIIASAPASAATNSEPNTIKVFNTTATPDKNIIFSNWQNMLKRQQQSMKNSQDARQYNNFLKQFDRFKGEPLLQMAQDVNRVVMNDVQYNDTQYKNPAIYWASPYQAEKSGLADCKGYAILQYSILRHLGVPQNRLFIASVNAEGSKTGTDHAILLLNVAKEGQPQKFYVLNDAAPVVPANNSIIENTWRMQLTADSTAKADFIVYHIFNPGNDWETQLGYKSLAPPPAKKSQAQVASPSQTQKVKIG